MVRYSKLVESIQMSLLHFGRSAIFFVFAVHVARAQLLPSQAAGAARAHVLMLSINGTRAAGIVVGFDAENVYIATATHVANVTSEPFPGVDVRFEDAPDVSRPGTFFAKFET